MVVVVVVEGGGGGRVGGIQIPWSEHIALTAITLTVPPISYAHHYYY